jgi:hypothetical protein
LMVKADAPLPPDQAAAVSRVVQAYGGPAAPDEFGYFFESAKAGPIEFYAGKRSGGMLAVRGWGPGKADFIFDILAATGWSMVVPSDPLVLIAARDLSAEERAELADAEYDFVVVASGADVMRAAEPAFGAWSDYRDQVVKG